jgi:hypothetical protein
MYVHVHVHVVHVCTCSACMITLVSTYFCFLCLFQNLSEEDADRPTLEVLRELVSFVYLEYIFW